ncbi:MAG: hypothetical protein J6A84_01740 [Clostridia bacterium]|nr:hypothetical protein [Clostridia bacterium]
MKRRILSLLLCIALLLSSVMILASCKKNKDKDGVSGDRIDVDLTGYTVIRDSFLTDLGAKQVYSVTKSIKNLTSVELSVFEDDSITVIEDDTPEILIGETSRKESLDTFDSIEGLGWAIRFFEETNKLVILGKTPYLTRVAMTHFERKYLDAANARETVLSIEKSVTVSDMETLSLKEGDQTFTVVYDQWASYMGFDYYPHDVSLEIQVDLLSKCGIEPEVVLSSAQPVVKEILVGNMDRPEMKEEIAKIEANEVALTMRGGKILLVSWCDETLGAAKELFDDMLFGSSVEDEAGNVTYQIPANCTVVQSYSDKWVVDFPKPTGENITPHGAAYVEDDYIQYIYGGSGVNREAFVAYCETLKAAGFTALGNEDVQWEGSSFRTFLNSDTGVTLHVSHMAFTHMDLLSGIWDYPLFNSIRIVAGSVKEKASLPAAQYFRPQIEGTEEQVKNGTADYVKKFNSRITVPRIDGTWGFGQIITLADGSFIIVDGGRTNSGMLDTFWLLLNSLHEEAHGERPTKQKPLHIRAWIITHEHGDHANMFHDFCVIYGNEINLKLDYLMMNRPSLSQMYQGDYGVIWSRLKTLQDAVKNGFEYIPVSTGQVFYFANCRLEIKYTIDDIYPTRLNDRHNDISVVTRTVLIESDGQKTHESDCLWLGDVEHAGSKTMMAMYGSSISSEQVSVSHHGNWMNAFAQFYQLLHPAVVWYPLEIRPGLLQDVVIGNGGAFSSMFKHDGCKLIIFNGSNTQPVAQRPHTTLVMSANGPLYDQIYDAATGEHVEAKSELWQVIDVQKLLGK